MSNEQLFSLATSTAMLGWLVLLISPLVPRWAEWISGRIIPVTLAVLYSALILVSWSSAEGGFGSLSEVMTLFTQAEVVLAGWLHYLAFDLFIGAWECRTARTEGIRFWLVIPCLVLTFLFGPAGLLAFMTLRMINQLNSTARPAA